MEKAFGMSFFSSGYFLLKIFGGSNFSLKPFLGEIMRDDIYDQMQEQEGYYWWHVGRRKLFLKLLKKYWPRKDRNLSTRLLDVGCGTGVMMQEVKPYGEIWGIDVKAKALQFCRRRKAGDVLIKANLEQRLPLKDDFFDIVLCFDVLEHLKKEDLVLSELRRILKKRGILLLNVPAYPRLWSYWDRMAGHYRRYNAKCLKKILKENGFTVVKLTYYYLFALLPAIIFRLIKSSRRSRIEDYPSDFVNLPFFVNKFLLFLAKVERFLLLVINLPAGLSLFCLARKEES